MRIGILGSGDVGRALGRGFVELGHEVMIGSRSPEAEKLAAWKKDVGSKGSTGLFAATAAFGEMLVLATRWSGTQEVLELAGAAPLKGKVLIDATNPLDFSKGYPPALALAHTDSGGEQVQRWAPEAKVVKAFNLVGNAHMIHPSFPGGPPDMWICGNDVEAKERVVDLLHSCGWSVIDLGGIEESRVLEYAAMLWIKTSGRLGSYNIALKMLRK